MTGGSLKESPSLQLVNGFCLENFTINSVYQMNGLHGKEQQCCE